MLAGSASTPSQAARRFHARRRLEGLSYVEFGPDNGAILIDLGEGGIGFQSVLPVTLNDTLLFKFKVPGESNWVEGFGEVAWMNDSGKGGGLRFTEVADADRAKIREWTGDVGAPETEGAKNGNGAEPHAAAAKTKEAANEEVNPAPSSTATNATDQAEAAAKASEEFAARESAQPPSPSTDTETDSSEPVQEAAAADQPVAAEIKDSEPPSIPEFTIEVTPAEPPTVRMDSAPAAPAFAADTLEQKPEVAQPATRPPVKGPTAEAPASAPAPGAGAELAAADARISAPVQTRHIPAPATAKPDANLDPARETANRETPQIRRTRPALHSNAGRKTAGLGAEEMEALATLASQALRIGIGVAAGATVVLLLFLMMPSLRTRVEATAPRPTAFNTAGAPAFEIEVADIDNRRWILRGSGEAGSPFATTSSRRETENSASAKSERSESSKASRAEETDNDSTTDTTAAKPKSPKPGELVLSRPRVAQQATASAQTVAPSIFDGITPPIGSLSDRLATGGPEAPGIVQPESRTTALQSAVLVQRVSPAYPPAAVESRLQGDVQVNATIGKDGIPKALKVLKGDVRLVPAALAAIRQWRYRPATLGGEPIETEIVITISFQIKG